MIRTRATPHNIVIGVFLVLVALVAAVAPLPLMYRSLGIVIASYLAFGIAGPPLAFLAALIAPPMGLLNGDPGWLIMLPMVLSSNLLAMLGLELTWRYPAVLLSPLLLVTPQVFVMQASKQRLFRVELPWDTHNATWIVLHAAVAIGGVLLAIYLHSRRTEGN
jgi:hypothetical protein